ncbi:MAG: hypothetical protein HUJ26_04655 [Planctomycetaceae bacterium]|nr:hypothetical protein [Planctomycetaceae bacterium]
MRCLSVWWLLCLSAFLFPESVIAEEPIEIGSRRELFVDNFLIQSLDGDAKQVLQQPTPHEVVLVTDKPWEGNTCAYYSIFQDCDLYRMYYRGSHWDTEKKRATHPEVVCYAESRDGIHWTKPELGLVEFDGSKANNIVFNGIGSHCFTPFIDTNPDCPPAARYKAIGRGRPTAKKGLYVFQSADGLHWSLMHDEPVITQGAFDSQNLAFWDPIIKKYRCYYRDFRKVRDIKWCVSDDFIHWSEPAFLTYPDQPLEHLYTNAIRNDPRAPHILIGFPTRYLPNEGQRVEPTFMSSRDGHTFHRWLKPVIPESAPKDRSGNRSNYMTWGLLELPSKPNEYSVYATEAYYTGPDSRVRRFTYRKDGYVAVTGEQKGSLLTKPIVYQGDKLSVNAKVADGGRLMVELLTSDGPVWVSDPVTGDSIDHQITWPAKSPLAKQAGKPVQIRFHLKNAELYSFQFQKDE